MKSHVKEVLIFFGILLITLVSGLLTSEQITISLHDTYLVIYRMHLMIFVFGLLTLLFFLIRGLIYSFKTIAVYTGLIIGLVSMSFIALEIIATWKNIINGLEKYRNDPLIPIDTLVEGFKNNINWAWGFFIAFIIGIAFLSFKMFRLLKALKHDQE